VSLLSFGKKKSRVETISSRETERGRKGKRAGVPLSSERGVKGSCQGKSAPLPLQLAAGGRGGGGRPNIFFS